MALALREHPTRVLGGKADTVAFTRAVLEARHDLPLRVTCSQENLGGAGGFHLGVRTAYDAGFDRVWWTIVDTHVASLISAMFLFQFGTGPIRGFATTLTIGLLANVFTAVFVSRTMFELVLSRRPQQQVQTLSI